MVEELRFEKAAEALKKKLKQRQEQLKKKKISKNQVIGGKEIPVEKLSVKQKSFTGFKRKITEVDTKPISVPTGSLAKLKADVLRKKREKLIEVKVDTEAIKAKPLPKVYSQPASKKKIEELGRFINENVKEEKVEESASVAQQLGAIKNYFTKGLKRSMGKKEIGKLYLKQLSSEEVREAKKLIPLLAPEIKRYTRQEIWDAIIMEGHSKKVARAVISALYQNY